MRRRGLVLAVCGALLVAACGDDDDGGGASAADVVLPSDACALVDGVDIAAIVGFEVEPLSSAGGGSFNDFEFESCSGLETDGGEHPWSVSVQLLEAGDPEQFRESQEGTEADDVNVGDLPDGTFTTEQFDSVVVWVPAGDGLMGVSVTRTVEGEGLGFESDSDAAVVLTEAIIAALAA